MSSAFPELGWEDASEAGGALHKQECMQTAQSKSVLKKGHLQYQLSLKMAKRSVSLMGAGENRDKKNVINDVLS